MFSTVTPTITVSRDTVLRTRSSDSWILHSQTFCLSRPVGSRRLTGVQLVAADPTHVGVTREVVMRSSACGSAGVRCRCPCRRPAGRRRWWEWTMDLCGRHRSETRLDLCNRKMKTYVTIDADGWNGIKRVKPMHLAPVSISTFYIHRSGSAINSSKSSCYHMRISSLTT